MMITIPSMPTRIRRLPELELELDIPQLRELAYVLDRVKVYNEWHAGLCVAVAGVVLLSVYHAFSYAVSRGMNKDIKDQYCMYLYQYLDDEDIAITIEELTAIRQAWAKHIARAIYEQIGE